MRLYLNPTPFRSKYPELKDLNLRTDEMNTVSVILNGKKGKLFPDSGSSCNAMNYRSAKRLRLLQKVDHYFVQHTKLFTGDAILRLGHIKRLNIKLSDINRSICCDVLVFPKEVHFRGLDVLLGCKTMCQERILQVYEEERSLNIHIPVPTFPYNLWCFFKEICVASFSSAPAAYVLPAHLKHNFTDPPIDILIDTGSTETCISEKFLQTLGVSSCPTQIRFPIGKNNHMHTTQLRVVRGLGGYSVLIGRKTL